MPPPSRSGRRRSWCRQGPVQSVSCTLAGPPDVRFTGSGCDVRQVAEFLIGDMQADQMRTVAAVELPNLKRLSDELEWFTLKYDFRNADKPWGNSRDAVERSINKLMGACVGDEAKMPAHND